MGFLAYRAGAKPYLPNFAITEFPEVRSQKAGAYDKPRLKSANLLPHQLGSPSQWLAFAFKDTNSPAKNGAFKVGTHEDLVMSGE